MKLGYVQARQAAPIPLQIEALAAAGCDKIYVEPTSVGITVCPQRDHLFTQLRPGDLLVIWKLICLAHSLTQCLTLIRMLHQIGADLCSLQDEIDTTRASDQHLFPMCAALDSFQHHLRQEQTHWGLASARVRGRTGGRPKGLSQEAQATARLAKQLYYQRGTRTVQDICLQLAISKGTFYTYLRVKEQDNNTSSEKDEY